MFFSTDVVSLLIWVIAAWKLCHLVFSCVDEAFRILNFWEFNFFSFFCEIMNYAKSFFCEIIITTEWTQIAFSIVNVAPFLAILLNCLRSWCFPLDQNAGVRFMSLTIPPKLLYQIRRALSGFVGPKRPLIAVFLGFSSRPNKEVGGRKLFHHIDKGTYCFVLFRFTHSIFDQNEWLLA